MRKRLRRETLFSMKSEEKRWLDERRKRKIIQGPSNTEEVERGGGGVDG